MGRGPDFGVQLSSAFLPVAEGFLKIGPANGKPPATSRARYEYDQAVEQFDSVGKGVARNPIQLVGLMLVGRQLAVADYLRGIATMAVHGYEQGRTISVSPAPVARAVLEALTHIYWMTDPDISMKERVRRLMWDAAHDIRTRHRVVTAAREGGVEPNLNLDDFADNCDLYEVNVTWGKPHNDTGISLPHVDGVDRPSAFDMMRDLAPAVTARQLGAIFYHLVTDVAHASTQGLLGQAKISDREDGSLDVSPLDRTTQLRQVSLVLYAVARPASRLISFYGQDEQPFHETLSEAMERLTAAASESGAGRE